MNRDDEPAAGIMAAAPGIGAATACAIAAACAAILLLALSSWFLTAAALAGASGAGAVAAFNYLFPSAGIRALAILRTATRYGERLLSHRAALLAMADLRGRLFGRLAAQDARVAPDLSGGDASARLIGDIEALEDLIIRKPARAAALAAALAGVALAGLAGWQAALALALLLALLPWLLETAAARWTRPPAREAAAALGALRTALVEYAAARPEIVAYALAERVTAELEAIAGRADRARAGLHRGDGAVAGLLVLHASVTAAIVLFLAHGAAPLVALALLTATASVEAMAGLARSALRRAQVNEGFARLQVIARLHGEPLRAVRRAAAPATLKIGAYDVAPGERVGIVGPSGSGKTRLLEALAGLQPPVHALFVDGQAVQGWSDLDLRQQFALVPQDNGLIAGTIADNLRIARPGVTETDMEAALATACLAERVWEMPAGVETWLEEGGGLLSGGERRRLVLARAILAERPWLLLDEPTEGLDSAAEELVVSRLQAWLDQTRTGLILVSHRPGPLRLTSRLLPIEKLARR